MRRPLPLLAFAAIAILVLCTNTTAVSDQTFAVFSVIIFDWDDTLLSSTFLSMHGFGLEASSVPREFDVNLRRLEAAVATLLQTAMNCGRVCIITNAETGWVQMSAQKFMPGLVNLLKKIEVLSARSAFEQHWPAQPKMWKVSLLQPLSFPHHSSTLNYHDARICARVHLHANPLSLVLIVSPPLHVLPMRSCTPSSTKYRRASMSVRIVVSATSCRSATHTWSGRLLTLSNGA